VKVLIATNELQGAVAGDFAHTVEGELVTPLVAACHDLECGCRRGFPGLASTRATTTATVVDRPGVTHADLCDAVRDYLERTGWIDLLARAADDRFDDDETFLGDVDDVRDAGDVEAMIAAIVAEHVEAIGEICDAVPLGTVIERHGDTVSIRALRHAA